MGEALSNRASTSNVSSPLTTRPDDLRQLNDSVWEFYKPPLDGDGVPKMEILFFHGAQLSIDTETFWKTWLSRDETVVWPTAWLAQKFPEARMLFISYDSSVRNSSGHKDMYQTIENLIHDIIRSSTCKAGQKCPVIFVGHCFGGIIIKQFLIRCSELMGLKHAGNSSLKEVEVLLHHCKAIFYYSTPNAGSGTVNGLAYIDKILGNFNQLVVDFLKTLSPHTARINCDFSNLRHDRNWKSVGIGETLQTTSRDFRKTMLVPQASARQDVDHIYWAQDADHFDVARAKNNFSCNIFKMLDDLVASYYSIPSLISTVSRLRSSLCSSTDEHNSVGKSNLAEVKERLTTRLPFGQDSKYVPIVSSVDKVRKALEREHGCPVVTVYGEPGLGKTSLVKYVALQYQPRHRTQEVGEVFSFAMFPDGVFFLRCGQGAEHKIRQLQHYLLQSLGCESEAIPADIPEERDGDYITIPTLRRRLQFRLRDVKALIILDDIWERSILEELILSPDEAGPVKFLITSQFRDIWPDALQVEMERPTHKEARRILLKYTKGLSTREGFPTNIQGIADSIIWQLQSHPLTLANVGLGFRQEEGQELDAWRAVLNAWQHEPPIKESYKPLIYGRGYSFTLDVTMTRVMRSLEGPTRDLLFLMCALDYSNFFPFSGCPEVVVKYLYKCAKIGKMGAYRFAINYLQRSSLVDVDTRYGSGHTELVIHRLRALSIISQFPNEVRVLARRALEPARIMCDHLGAQSTRIGFLIRRGLQQVRNLYSHHGAQTALIADKYCDLYSHHGAQTALIADKYCDSADVHDGLLNASMVGMYIDRGFLDDARVVIPRGVDIDVEGLLETAGRMRERLQPLVRLLRPDPSGEKWKREAALCAGKVIVKFTCRRELDDKSVARLIQHPGTRREVLKFLIDILQNGYWCTSFSEDNRTFSSGHSQIARSLYALVHDDPMSEYLTDVLFGMDSSSNGTLDYENDETIVNIGERLIQLALGENSNINFECVPSQKFPSSYSKAFRVIEKEIPDLWNAMLALHVQKCMGSCKWFSSSPREGNVSIALWECSVLGMLCGKVDDLLGHGNVLATLEWLSSRAENRAYLSASPQIMEGVIAVLVQATEDSEISSASNYPRFALGLLRNLALSQESRQKILSTYPSVVETLERLEPKYYCDDSVSVTIGILDSEAPHVKISDYNPAISQNQFEQIMLKRIQGYFQSKRYQEFLSFVKGKHLPRDVKQYRTTEIIVAKTMLKRYQSALADAHADVLEREERWKEQPSPSIGRFLELRRTAWAVGLEGTVKLLSGTNSREALVDFERAVHLLSLSLSSREGLEIRDCVNEYFLLMYEMLKQRGYTKHLMADNVGATEDARAAQQLRHRNLIWSRYYFREYQPHSLLFSRPLAYLGFTF